MATNPRYANGHRRRKLRARLLASETQCGICGHPLNASIRTPHPMSPEVDEITPLAFGGNPLSRDNTRLVHRICNQRRGAAMRTPPISPSLAGPLPTSQEW